MPRTVVYLHSSAGRYGADRQLLALATGIEGWTPLVVLPEDGPLGDQLRAAGVEVRVHPLAVLRRRALSPLGLARLAPALAADRRLLAELAGERDIALVHSNTSVVLAQPRDLPHVIHVREIYSGAAGRGAGMGWGALRKRLLQADALLCVSNAVARQFPAGPEVVNDGLARMPSPMAREAARSMLGLPGDAFVVALLGRVCDWKGQDVLARALARAELADADMPTVGLIAGDGYGDPEPERALAGLRDSLGLGDRLRLAGYIEADQAFGAADVVALPSTRPDPFPNSALEAAAAGLPVVASSHGGLPEIVRDGETGFLVTPGDPAALARALRELADDPERRERMGASAAADARERFDPRRMLDQVQAVYERLT